MLLLAFVNQSKMALQVIVAFAYFVILMKKPTDILFEMQCYLIYDEGVALVTNSFTNDIVVLQWRLGHCSCNVRMSCFLLKCFFHPRSSTFFAFQ